MLQRLPVLLAVRRQVAQGELHQPFLRKLPFHVCPDGLGLLLLPRMPQDETPVQGYPEAVVQFFHLPQGLLRLRQPVVCQQIVHQPQVSTGIVRVLSDKVLIELNEPVVIVGIPVGRDSAHGRCQLIVGVLFTGAQGQGTAGVLRRQLLMLPGLVVVELGQQTPAPAGPVSGVDAAVQKTLRLFQLSLGQHAAVPDHILDAIQLVVIRQTEQRVQGDAKIDGDHRQQLNIRGGHARFP